MHDVESLLTSVDNRPVPLRFGRGRLAVRPLSLLECLRLIADYPALKPLLFPTKVDIARFEALITEGRDGLVAFVAKAVRKPRLVIRVLPDQLLLPPHLSDWLEGLTERQLQHLSQSAVLCQAAVSGHRTGLVGMPIPARPTMSAATDYVSGPVGTIGQVLGDPSALSARVAAAKGVRRDRQPH